MSDALCGNSIDSTMNFLLDNILRVPRETQEAANSLLLQWSQRPERFSEKQAKFAASIAAKLRGPQIQENLGSFEPVIALFEKARRKSKTPKFRFQLPDGQKVVLSLAGPNAAYPGTVNCSDGGPYGDSIFFGRISKDGIFEVRVDYPGIKELLQKVVTDPLGTAKEYGKLTGICCCCGRELTDPVSIANSIGPICESKFF